MLNEIRGKALLDGAHGSRPGDREALISLPLDVSRIALAHAEIGEIDLNPVIANAKGVTIVDARILRS